MKKSLAFVTLFSILALGSTTAFADGTSTTTTAGITFTPAVSSSLRSEASVTFIQDAEDPGDAGNETTPTTPTGEDGSNSGKTDAEVTETASDSGKNAKGDDATAKDAADKKASQEKASTADKKKKSGEKLEAAGADDSTSNEKLLQTGEKAMPQLMLAGFVMAGIALFYFFKNSRKDTSEQ